MADNILLPSHGTSIATDDVGGVHFYKTKLSIGADGVDGGVVSSANPLPVTQPGSDADSGKQSVGNVREKWKVGFSNITDFAANFTEVSKPASDLVHADGNVAGSSWIDICKSTTTGNTETVYIAKKAFKVPYALEYGVGFSQRFNGQEFYAEMVGVNADADGNVTSVIATNPTIPADNTLSASVTVATNVWTVTLTNSAWAYLRIGDWVCIAGCADSRLNVGPVLITNMGSSANNVIHITSTLTDGTYTGFTGGYLRVICHCGGADYHHGVRFWGTSNSNADTISRNGATDSTGGGNRPRVVTWNPGNTQFDSAVPNEGGLNYASQQYTRPFRAKGVTRTEHVTGSLSWVSKDQDSVSATRSASYRESEVPAQDQWYALRIRAMNLPNLTVPVGTSLAITAVSKSGTTTWTVTCPGHGLTVNDRVRIYGVRDITNFPNLTTDTVVAGVTDANVFTIVSTTGTATSYGGFVLRVNGGAVPTISAINIQSYNKSFDDLRLVLTGNTTWAATYANIVDVQGLVNSSNAHVPTLCGRYRVARISTTSLELDPMDGQAAAVAAISGSVTAGGSYIQNTSFRWHFARVVDYFRMLIDTANSGAVDARSLPVRVANTVTISGTVTSSGAAAAHDAAISGNPVRTAGRAQSAAYATVATGDTADYITTLQGVQITKPYQIPELEWAVSDEITASTTAVQVKVLAASLKQCVSSLSIATETLGAAGYIQLRSTPVASNSATIASNTLVMAATYNWRVGEMVYVTASTVTGLTAGSYYYILTVSGANLTFSATRGGGTLAISGTTVSATLSKIIWRTYLNTTALPLTQVQMMNPGDGGTGLSLEVCTPTSLTSGKVSFSVVGYTAP